MAPQWLSLECVQRILLPCFHWQAGHMHREPSSTTPLPSVHVCTTRSPEAAAKLPADGNGAGQSHGTQERLERVFTQFLVRVHLLLGLCAMGPYGSGVCCSQPMSCMHNTQDNSKSRHIFFLSPSRLRSPQHSLSHALSLVYHMQPQHYSWPWISCWASRIVG
jgi:hypothetical protein